ncbi:Rrf2 family transcriptional regulator [Methylocystis sp. IM4]|uniref:RrF2 family transcriptional regulator n=1 Tax=Methylocystis sp. IM4 TaxID=3136560 RepID=UPI00311934B3
MPPRRLETLLQTLVRAGILKSVRGPAGGYELARERRRLCVGEIVRVALRAEEEADQAPALLVAILEPLIAEAEEATLARLDEITLEDLYARAVAQGFGEKQPTTDFEI